MTVAAHTGAGHRERLVGAMADLLAERGYGSVTVAEIVARARVSKRTFYEQFAEREDCFLATYAALAEEPFGRIAAAAADPASATGVLAEHVGRAVGAYLEAMTERPTLTRALLVEIAAVGPRGRAVRREVLHRFAALLVALADEARAAHPGVAPLSAALALGLVGGINELVLDAVESWVGESGSGGSGAGESGSGESGSGESGSGESGSGEPWVGEPVAADGVTTAAELDRAVTDLVVAVLLRPG